MTNENAKNVHQRIAQVMETVTYIRKENKKGMQYTIVSHDAVTAKVRPELLKAGVIYYPVRCEHSHNGNRAECSMTIRFANIDAPTDYIDVPTFGYGVDGQDKGPGKAMSYAVKYALLKCLGLETGDDADHDNVDHSQVDPHTQPDHGATVDRLKAAIEKQADTATLEKLWAQSNFQANVNALPDDMKADVQKAYADKQADLFLPGANE